MPLPPLATAWHEWGVISFRFIPALVAGVLLLAGCATQPNVVDVEPSRPLVDMWDRELLTFATQPTYKTPQITRADVERQQAQRVQARDVLLERHPEWGADLNEAVKRRELKVGMNKWQAQLVAGVPVRVNTSGGTWGQDEQWVIHEHAIGRGYQYVYFENDRVTAWQGSN